MVQAVPKLRYRLVGARISPLSLSLEEAMLCDFICFCYFYLHIYKTSLIFAPTKTHKRFIDYEKFYFCYEMARNSQTLFRRHPSKSI